MDWILSPLSANGRLVSKTAIQPLLDSNSAAKAKLGASALACTNYALNEHKLWFSAVGIKAKYVVCFQAKYVLYSEGDPTDIPRPTKGFVGILKSDAESGSVTKHGHCRYSPDGGEMPRDYYGLSPDGEREILVARGLDQEAASPGEA